MSDRCSAGDRCVAPTPDGAAITSQPLCHGCVDALQDRYDQLPAILEVLPMFKGGLWGASDQAKVSKGKGEAPSPLNAHCVDVIDMIEAILEDVGSLRVADLVRHEFGISRALKIGRAWKMADGIIGFAPRWERLAAPCDECGQRTLGRLYGTESVNCSNCGHRLTLQDYKSQTIVAG